MPANVLVRQKFGNFIDYRMFVLVPVVALVGMMAGMPFFYLLWSSFKPISSGNLSDFSLSNFTLKNF